MYKRQGDTHALAFDFLYRGNLGIAEDIVIVSIKRFHDTAEVLVGEIERINSCLLYTSWGIRATICLGSRCSAADALGASMREALWLCIDRLCHTPVSYTHLCVFLCAAV